MTTDDLTVIYGTASASPPPERLEVGPLAIDVADGMVTRVGWHGAEVLRGIAYLVRTRDWGTFADRTISSAVERHTERLTYRRDFDTAEGAISGSFTCELYAHGRLQAHVTLRALRDATINRAGFVVLHPTTDEAGVPLKVTDADGTEVRTTLPKLISAGQPVRNIRALAYEVPAAGIRITFQGDIFEMEDQRNWTDASFKTYCRPLALPYPYGVQAGLVWEQTITLDLSGGSASRQRPKVRRHLSIGAPNGVMPQVALATMAEWENGMVAMPSGTATVLRTDLRDLAAAATCADLVAQAQGPVEIEAVLPDDPRLAQSALASLADQLECRACVPASLTVLPAAYLASYQPDGPWPQGATPFDARTWAAALFPNVTVGFGVFNNFTELNRLPQRAANPAFVTYGTTAIVHAADDLSVMQTLEALPQVHASAAALFPGCALRLGLVGIGMRSNPYGAACAPNPGGRRVACAMDDPRQRGLFGAAFMVGAVASTLRLPVERITLGSHGGPFALVGDDGKARLAWPVFRALASLSGAVRHAVEAPAGLTAVAAALPDGGTRLIVANTTSAECPLDIASPAMAFLLDHRSAPAFTDPAHDLPLAQIAAGRIVLGPYAVLFADLGKAAA